MTIAQGVEVFGRPWRRPSEGPYPPQVPRSGLLVARVVLAAVVALRASCVAVAPKRARRGKKGVTSNGILSRAEVMATGAVFTISALSSQGLIFTRPPKGRAAI